MAYWWEEQDNLDKEIIRALQDLNKGIPGINGAPITYPKNIDKANLPIVILWPGAGSFFQTKDIHLSMDFEYTMEIAIEPISQGYSNLWVTRQKSQVLRTSFWEIYGCLDNEKIISSPNFNVEVDNSRTITVSGLLPSPNEGDYLKYNLIDYFGIRVTLPLTASGKVACS
jgi:hypothetical protein